MTPSDQTGESHWAEAMATVTACKYEFGAGRALAFGIPTSRHFRISFNYWANDELHEGEYTAEAPVPQGTLFPVKYNLDAPHEHDRGSAEPASRSPLIAFGILGSVVLSLLWLLVLRGCS